MRRIKLGELFYITTKDTIDRRLNAYNYSVCTEINKGALFYISYYYQLFHKSTHSEIPTTYNAYIPYSEVLTED